MIGQKVLHYRVLEKLGEGGMGEVFLAEDTKLDRKVALKFLPHHFGKDPDFKARFEHEAKAAAALNHPNIVTVFELNEHEGRLFIAMEYVEGKSLEQLIAAGDLPLEQAVDYARQVAEGLDRAHRAGIVHRDIKPSNILIDTHEQARILDFGLAKSHKATTETKIGTTVGTLYYESPEQTVGKPVDARSDLFSLGSVLYEMVTGRPPFTGEIEEAIRYSILNESPEPLVRYKAGVPAELQRIVSKLLSKKLAERYQHADEVAVDLRAMGIDSAAMSQVSQVAPVSQVSTATAPPPTAATERKRGGTLAVIPWLIAVVVILFLGWQLLKPSAPSDQHSYALPVAVPAEYELSWASSNQVAMSPAGDRWVCMVVDSESVAHTLLWEAGNLEPRVLEEAEQGGSFSFSPDGNWLGFIADGVLKKLHLAGGKPVDLGRALWLGIDWVTDDTIYYCPEVSSGVWKIATNGGDPVQVTRVSADEFAHWSPELLPGGRALLFTVWKTSIRDIATHILDFQTGEQRVLIQGGAHAQWISTGHLAYIRRGTLMAVPFDPKSLQVTGSEVPVIPHVQQRPGVGLGSYAFSQDGFLVVLRGGAGLNSRRFAWVDEKGKVMPLNHPAGAYDNFDLSPDDEHLVYDKTKEGVESVWQLDLSTGVSTQLTFEGANFDPMWNPSGDRIAFTTYRHGPYSVYEMPVDRSGPERPLIVRDVDAMTITYTPDGERLIIWLYSGSFGHLHVLSLADTSRIDQLTAEPFGQYQAAVHPDGEWMAYASSESGRGEIYVRPLDGGGRVVQVSVNGGGEPKWSADGGTLYYWQSDRLFAVDVQAKPELRVGTRRELFKLPDVIDYDVASDGRFMVLQDDPTSKPELTVVTNWFEDVKRLTEEDK